LIQSGKSLKQLKRSYTFQGQVLIEYAIMLMICIFIALALMAVFGVLGGYETTLVKFIGVDYP
jgi:hypothetical protein